ncbi:MAG: FAD-dependent oxidoreductase, partial [Rhizobiales bacterium]|nr:FAD-dependent oxidoreductase [Hyphomicrobiales bacterium]
MKYDLVVIGSGPSGQRAAIQAAKLGKHVAVIEKQRVVGGVCVNTGTIPSKTFRESVLHLSGFRERGIYGNSYTVRNDIKIEDLLFRVEHVVRGEIDVIRGQLARNKVQLIEATACFVDANHIRLEDGSEEEHIIQTDKVVIACGTNAARDPHITFDGQRIMVSDDILQLRSIPRSLIVIGAGVIGVEYATMFAALGVRVTIIDKRPTLLPFLDHEISAALTYIAQQNRVTMRLGEEVAGVKLVQNLGPSGERTQVEVGLKSGKMLHADAALYAIGRTGATAGLDLGKAGVKLDERGKIIINQHYQTSASNI